MPNAPLALYIHWPFCLSKCPYCDFNSHVRERVDAGRWKAGLLAEMGGLHARLPGRVVGSIFFGGGTPSLMPPDVVAALIARAGELWGLADRAEITLEANPTSVESEKFAQFRRAGVNRVSVGVQSLDGEALAFLGRQHNADEARRTLALAAEHFERFSFDLIYARPGQTAAAWEAELGEALKLARGHLSLYQLTIEENTAFHHAYAKGGFALPDEEESEALYRLTEAMAAQAGLFAYEVSNYAQPGQESRHNLTYWQGGDYAGIGPGAHGRLTLPEGRTATQTVKSPERWLEQVEREGHGTEIWESVERSRESEERLMMGLRLTGGIDLPAFHAQTGYDLLPHLDEGKIALYRRQGLLDASPEVLRATLKGRLVLSRLTGELLG